MFKFFFFEQCKHFTLGVMAIGGYPLPTTLCYSTFKMFISHKRKTCKTKLSKKKNNFIILSKKQCLSLKKINIKILKNHPDKNSKKMFLFHTNLVFGLYRAKTSFYKIDEKKSY